ncbi:hypothetical protein [Streptomyces sp. W007]|uniref:hypothetical protein n=1 Tax=Streptomyces sp. W007 TaxID=1055352 RepID=UPI001ED91239|nr:hypothetical protein [Streptomyces sp. W007]
MRKEDPYVLVTDPGCPEARKTLAVEGDAGHGPGERLHSGNDGSVDRHGLCPFVRVVGLSASPAGTREPN